MSRGEELNVSEHRIAVKVRDYRGADPKKRAKWYGDVQLARRIEEYLQPIYDSVPPGGVETVFSYSVARQLGADAEKVRLLMCSIQGGSNGVTFMKPDADGNYLTQR